MSHFVRVKTQFSRRSALVSALQEAGSRTGASWVGKVEDHAEATQLFGYSGDQREDSAELVVRRQYVGGAANDIGFKLQKDGTYEAIISEYDRSCGYNEKWLQKLAKLYAKNTILEVAGEQGFTVESQTQQEDGLCIECSSWE